MRRRWISGLAAAAMLAAAAGAPVHAEDFLRPLNLPKGTVINFNITRTSVATSNGVNTGEGVTLKFLYRLSVEPNENGYRVKIAYAGMESPKSMSSADRAAMEQGAKTNAGLEYQADADLYPLELIDWQSQIDRIIGQLATMIGASADNPQVMATRQFYAGMSPQQAASSLLGEWAMTTSAQNMALDVGKPKVVENTLDGPGGVKVKVTETAELKQIDRGAGRAIVQFHQGFDPASTGPLLQATIQAIVAALPADQRPAATNLSGLKMEQTTDCRYEMDLASGLARKTDCTKTVWSVDQSLKPAGKVDHWIITQDIIAP